MKILLQVSYLCIIFFTLQGLLTSSQYQFVRGEYGAFALLDSTSSELHLRASGTFQSISPFVKSFCIYC